MRYSGQSTTTSQLPATSADKFCTFRKVLPEGPSVLGQFNPSWMPTSRGSGDASPSWGPPSRGLGEVNRRWMAPSRRSGGVNRGRMPPNPRLDGIHPS